MVLTDINFMKNNKLIFLLFFVINSVFSQEKLNTKFPVDSIKTTNDSSMNKANNKNKWSIQVGAGVSNGTSPYTEKYFTSTNNELFNGFILNCYTVGASYKFSQIIGIKMDVAFDRFTNKAETKSNPFEVAQYRSSVQAVFNFNSFIKSANDVSRFNVLLHGGIHLAILQPITSNYNKKYRTGDNYGGIVFGISPILRISRKTSIFVDISSFNNYGQNLTWNGKSSAASNNSAGHMYSGTLGLSFALNNN